MSATPFRPVLWQPEELLDNDKLNQMTNNDQWLYENTPKGIYTAHGIKKPDGVRLVGGLALIHAKKGRTAQVPVRFGNYFSAACQPIVTYGIISGTQRQFFVTLDGFNGALHPDHRGFQVHVQMDPVKQKKRNKIIKNFYVSWMALGF